MRWKESRTGCPAFLSKFIVIGGNINGQSISYQHRGSPENPIQRARVKAGLTQVEAVEFFPFELRTLQAYEAGDSSPVLEDARIMAKVYHCRIDELVGDETT